MSDNQSPVVLIIGGGRGIGRTIAQYCVREGFRTVVAARSVPELEETVNTIRAEIGNDAPIWYFTCDITDDRQVRSLVSKIEAEIGPIFGLICSAGAYGVIGPFDEVDFDEWTRGLELNVFGPARAVHAVMPFMKQR